LNKVLNRLLVMTPGERLCFDVFFLTFITQSGKSIMCPFLMCVDSFTERRDIVWLASCTTQIVWNTIRSIIRYYNSLNWVVREISADREAVFHSIQPYLDAYDPRITFDRRGTDQKQCEAERVIRSARDIFRTIKSSLWYKLTVFFSRTQFPY
jgi:hypothetical protein